MADVNTVYCVPALSLLEYLDTGEAGGVILDPPARIGVSGDEDSTPIDELIDAFSPIAKQVYRVLHRGGTAIMMGEPQTVAAWELAAAWADLRFMAEMIVLWRTEEPRITMDSMTMAVRWYIRPGWRYTFHPRDRQMASNAILCHRIPPLDRKNPAQKPVELFNYVISLLTDQGDLIVDPYCGAGSALVAAAMCGRPWVGGDADSAQCSIAISRTTPTGLHLETAELRPLSLWTARGEIEIEG